MSPVLSNISIDGSQKNEIDQDREMKDFKLPMRERSISANTMGNVSMHSN